MSFQGFEIVFEELFDFFLKYRASIFVPDSSFYLAKYYK